ncbi:hypothetical protein P4H26_22305, partial [Paenibacillus larvae]
KHLKALYFSTKKWKKYRREPWNLCCFPINYCRELKINKTIGGDDVNNNFVHYAMPMYSYDHGEYFRQMYEWHMKMQHYQEQLRNYHISRAEQFQKMLREREKTVETSKDGPAA